MDISIKVADAAWRFYNDPLRDINGRYRSWEHCYKVFHDARLKRQKGEVLDYDYLSLHLAFYLASWGMFRGSSFLLQYDYKVHTEVATWLLDEKYDSLQGASCNVLKNNLNLLFDGLCKRLQKFYKDRRQEVARQVGKDLKSDVVSETLITKILMGTLGCVPAYDTYFVKGIKVSNVSTGNFNESSILKLIDFYEAHSDVFEKKRKELHIIEENGLRLCYPQMKLLDMAFWLVGKERADEEEREKNAKKGKGNSSGSILATV